MSNDENRSSPLIFNKHIFLVIVFDKKMIKIKPLPKRLISPLYNKIFQFIFHHPKLFMPIFKNHESVFSYYALDDKY